MSRAVKRSVPQMALRLLENRIDIVGDDAALLERFARCFEPCAEETPRSSGEAGLTVHLTRARRGGADGAGRLDVATQPAGALDALTGSRPRSPLDLTRALVQWAVSNTGRYVFHAGAVQRHAGGILLPARSHSGKSTLAAALGKRGFALLSDEVGAIEPSTGRLLPFPRALSLRRDVFSLLGISHSLGESFDRGASRMVRATELSIERAEVGAEVSLVVIPSFEAGSTTRMERLATGAAVMALMHASCSQPRFKAAGLDFVIDLARRIPCYELRFSDLWEAVDRIEATFEGPASAVPQSRGASGDSR